MLNTNELQAELKRCGVTQRELVRQSGLSESVVSIIIKNAPRLLPHLINALGKNPFVTTDESSAEKMYAALEKLSKKETHLSITDPLKWQTETRIDKPLPGRENS